MMRSSSHRSKWLLLGLSLGENSKDPFTHHRCDVEVHSSPLGGCNKTFRVNLGGRKIRRVKTDFLRGFLGLLKKGYFILLPFFRWRGASVGNDDINNGC